MDDRRDYFEGRAQCRRLAGSVDDRRATEKLMEMAREFDAKAKRAGQHQSQGESQDGPES